MAWTRFWDSHSGGGAKIPLPWGSGGIEVVYIEASRESEARELFTKQFGRDPDNITCHCCGPDYWVEFIEGTIEEDLSNMFDTPKGAMLILTEDE